MNIGKGQINQMRMRVSVVRGTILQIGRKNLMNIYHKNNEEVEQ